MSRSIRDEWTWDRYHREAAAKENQPQNSRERARAARRQRRKARTRGRIG